MAYTWEEVMLGIDVRKELSEKEESRREIERKKAKEEEQAGLFGLGLSVLGAIVGGPLGYTLGKNIGEIGADYGWWGGDYSDWEEDVAALDVGKFYTGEAKRYKEDLQKEIDKEGTERAIGIGTDLISMYLMAGGLEKGPMDWTTFGGGEDQWTVFGREGGPTFGAPSEQLVPGLGGPVSRELTPVTFESDIPGLKQIYAKGGIKGIGKTVGGAYNTGGTIADLIARQEAGS